MAEVPDGQWLIVHRDPLLRSIVIPVAGNELREVKVIAGQHDLAALQQSLAKFKGGFAVKRAETAARLPEFEALRDNARDLKNHILEHLDYYLEKFEQQV